MSRVNLFVNKRHMFFIGLGIVTAWRRSARSGYYCCPRQRMTALRRPYPEIHQGGRACTSIAVVPS
jgi:hypothetical protein